MMKPSQLKMIKEIILFVEDNNIIHADELINYAKEDRFSTWFPYLCSEKSHVIFAFIDSRRRKQY